MEEAGLGIRKGMPGGRGAGRGEGLVPCNCRQVEPILELLASGEPEVDV